MRSLAECLSDFEVCARRAVESILRVPTRVRRGFVAVQAGKDRHPVLCSVRCENGDLSVCMSMGMSPGDLERLMESFPDPRRRLDIIGEIMNTLAGNFLGRQAFLSKYGEFTTSLPQFGEKCDTSGEDEAIEGTMEILTAKVRFRLAVSATRVRQP
jgi:hypothetical protein